MMITIYTDSKDKEFKDIDFKGFQFVCLFDWFLNVLLNH